MAHSDGWHRSHGFLGLGLILDLGLGLFVGGHGW
jgi:hypothetical protein